MSINGAIIVFTMSISLLANLNGQNSTSILQNSANLLQNTVASWNQIWNIVFVPSGQLWASLCDFSLTLAGIGIVYTTFKLLPEVLRDGHWSRVASMFVMPLMLVIFLGGNGRLASATVLTVRGIGYGQISSMVQQQVNGQTFQVSLQAMQQNAAGSHVLRQIYSSCMSLPPAQQQDCINDPAKAQQAQQAMAQLGITSPPTIGNILADPAGAMTGVIMVILYGVQWAFVNCMEAALIMTGLFFPIAFALSILPISPKPLYAWFVAMIALFGVELAYNIVTGLVATVSLNASSGAGAMQSGQDIAFALFLAVFSPSLALMIGSGGGIALFRHSQSGMKGAAAGATSAVNMAVNKAIGWKQASALSSIAQGISTSQAQSSSTAKVAPPANSSMRALPQAKG